MPTFPGGLVLNAFTTTPYPNTSAQLYDNALGTGSPLPIFDLNGSPLSAVTTNAQGFFSAFKTGTGGAAKGWLIFSGYSHFVVSDEASDGAAAVASSTAAAASASLAAASAASSASSAAASAAAATGVPDASVANAINSPTSQTRTALDARYAAIGSGGGGGGGGITITDNGDGGGTITTTGGSSVTITDNGDGGGTISY